MLNQRRVVFGMFVVVSGGLSNAWVQSTLHIGPGAGTKCATRCAGDPNLLDGARTVDIYQTSNGAPNFSQRYY
jgi:hypothetical protein